MDGSIDTFGKELVVEVQILSDAKPESEELLELVKTLGYC